MFRLLFLVALSIASTSIHAQTLKRECASDNLETTTAAAADGRTCVSNSPNDPLLAARAVNALKELEACVVISRSLGEFEIHRKLARVSFVEFNERLWAVLSEVEPILAHLSDAKLRAALTNALYSFRDGAFWWAQSDQPSVVAATTLSFASRTATPAEHFLISSIPYTVAMHWRQASGFLLQAERLLTQKKVRNL